MTWFFIYLQTLSPFQWKGQWYTGNMLSLKLSHQRKLWPLPSDTKFMSFSAINLCLVFSMAIIPDLRRSWSPSSSPMWVLRSELLCILQTGRCTHFLGQVMQGQTEILGLSHHWSLLARGKKVPFFKLKNYMLTSKT